VINKFVLGQRVRVYSVRSHVDGRPVALDSLGTVARLRRDDAAAYVQLDVRSMQRGVHGFPLGDTRERQVLVQPKDCDPVEDRI
jgi:hypothetical protein